MHKTATSIKGMRSKGPVKTKTEKRHSLSDFPALSTIEDNEVDEEFHDLIEDVKLIKGILTNSQAYGCDEAIKGAETSIQAEMKAPKNKDIEEI